MSVGHFYAGACGYGGQVYTWGGNLHPGQNTRTAILEIFDPETDSWIRGADMPEANTAMGSFELGGKLYSIGGNGPILHQHSKAVYRYIVAENRWEVMNNFPRTACWIMGEECNGKAYVFGGRANGASPPTLKELYEYDETHDAWLRKADMPFDVQRAGTVSYDGRIWVFGGSQEPSAGVSVPLRTIQRYDPASDSWTLAPDMPWLLASPVEAALIGDEVWLFASRVYDATTDGFVPSTHEVFVYSLRDALHERRPLPFEVDEAMTPIVTLSRQAYVLSRYVGDVPSNIPCRIMDE